MNKIDMLVKEVEEVPEPVMDEILDFVRFLKERPNLDREEATLAGEQPLAMDWLTPEEVREWQKLWAAMW